MRGGRAAASVALACSIGCVSATAALKSAGPAIHRFCAEAGRAGAPVRCPTRVPAQPNKRLPQSSGVTHATRRAYEVIINAEQGTLLAPSYWSFGGGRTAAVWKELRDDANSAASGELTVAKLTGLSSRWSTYVLVMPAGGPLGGQTLILAVRGPRAYFAGVHLGGRRAERLAWRVLRSSL